MPSTVTSTAVSKLPPGSVARSAFASLADSVISVVSSAVSSDNSSEVSPADAAFDALSDAAASVPVESVPLSEVPVSAFVEPVLLSEPSLAVVLSLPVDAVPPSAVENAPPSSISAPSFSSIVSVSSVFWLSTDSEALNVPSSDANALMPGAGTHADTPITAERNNAIICCFFIYPPGSK